MQADWVQALIVTTIGDTPAGTLAANVEAVAALYAGTDAPFAALLLPGQSLERLAIERDLLKMKLAWAEGQVTNATDRSSSAESDIAKACRGRAAALETQLTDLADRLRLSAPALIGTLTTVSPRRPPLPRPFPNADDARYQGDPYVRPWKPQTS